MYDSKKDLLERIRLGETSFLELKEVRFSGKRIVGPHRDSLADEIAAFANGRGGVLVLGVDDRTREILGVPSDRLDCVVDFIRDVCSDSVEPSIENLVLDRLSLPTETGQMVDVVKVEIPRSLFIHRSPGGFLHRVADTKRRMSTEYLTRMLQQRSQTRLVRFDEQVVDDARVEDLNPALWSRWRTARSEPDISSFLHKLGLVSADDAGVLRPTVAGVLMASDDSRRWLPNAYIQAVAYHGDAIRTGQYRDCYQLDASDIWGSLDRQIWAACQFVFRNMKTRASKILGRVDRPQFDGVAVFEAMVNAVAHRDYSIYGSKIRLRLFEDRLELYSPGSIVNSLSIESLRYRQAARNESLCSLLTKCSAPDEPWLVVNRTCIMEKRGEGVPIILDNSESLSGRLPEYRLIDDSELLLTIYAAGSD